MHIFEPIILLYSMKYIWQHKTFPNFRYDQSKLIGPVQSFTLQIGQTKGLLQGLTSEDEKDLFLEVLLSEALKTSEIEGEYFSREDVMSSLRKQLGLHNTLPKTRDKNAEAIAKLTIEVRDDYKQKLSEKLLKKWHATLTEFSPGINAGKWRKGKEPMQIISGNVAKVDIHYEAPPSDRVPSMMKDFVQWYHGFNCPELGSIGAGMLKAALAHLYFETIHPFEDGNGRIGRVLAEKILAEALDMPLYISISSVIGKNKKRYYEELKTAQRNVEITKWVLYFFDVLIQAEQNVKSTAKFCILKTRFFAKHKEHLNQRQVKAIQKMMEYGEDGFEGGMTAKKYSSINKTSKATATRDLQELVSRNAFSARGAGRSIHYQLNLREA